MIINDIKKLAKENKVVVLFDMDGVLAEYGVGEKERIASNEPNLFLNARPLFENIKKVKKISKIKNVIVGIQSNCQYKEQKQDKKAWLQKYVPFVSKEDINIIALKEIEYEKETKYSLKAKYIKKSKGISRAINLLKVIIKNRVVKRGGWLNKDFLAITNSNVKKDRPQQTNKNVAHNVFLNTTPQNNGSFKIRAMLPNAA